jgi:hypothetical protein
MDGEFTPDETVLGTDAPESEVDESMGGFW